MEELLAYRFHEGALAGQSFGNLFLAALDGISPSFDQAVEKMNQILAVTGRVLPVTNSNVNLVAEFENGTFVQGESKICGFKRSQHCRIRRVRLEPSPVTALPQALEAIRGADVIVLGPGSLYTSVIPNLLVSGVARAIADSKALRLYIANIMTQEGETEGYTLSEHIQALEDHGLPGMIDLCLANSAVIPESVRERYRSENAQPMLVDADQIRAKGVELVSEPLSDETKRLKARHDPYKLARAILSVVEDRCVRTWTDQGVRYVRER